MDHFFTSNSLGRVFGFLEVNSVWKKWKIYPNLKIPEIFGFLHLGLSLEPDTWLYLFGNGISQTQPMWGHTQIFSSFGPLILHLPGGGWISPPLTQIWSWDPLTIRVNILIRENTEPVSAAGVPRAQIYKHTPSATLILIFPGICGTYLVTAVHLPKRIFVTNLLEICTHISGLCKCVHTKGYCMHTSTKYPPIYPPMTIYSHEGCLVHTYSKYSPTYTYCVLGRILEHQLQMSLDIKLK